MHATPHSFKYVGAKQRHTLYVSQIEHMRGIPFHVSENGADNGGTASSATRCVRRVNTPLERLVGLVATAVVTT